MPLALLALLACLAPMPRPAPVQVLVVAPLAPPASAHGISYRTDDAAFWAQVPSTLEDPRRTAGCACSTRRFPLGFLRVRPDGDHVVVDALCGSLWQPVRQSAGPASWLIDDIVRQGWPPPARCRR